MKNNFARCLAVELSKITLIVGCLILQIGCLPKQTTVLPVPTTQEDRNNGSYIESTTQPTVTNPPQIMIATETPTTPQVEITRQKPINSATIQTVSTVEVTKLLQSDQTPQRGSGKIDSALNQLLEVYYSGGLNEAQDYAATNSILLISPVHLVHRRDHANAVAMFGGPPRHTPVMRGVRAARHAALGTGGRDRGAHHVFPIERVDRNVWLDVGDVTVAADQNVRTHHDLGGVFRSGNRCDDFR